MTWRTAETLAHDCQFAHSASVLIDGSFLGPITHHTAISIDNQLALTLGFVSTAAAWNSLSDEDEDDNFIPADALPTNKASTNPPLSIAAQVAELWLRDSSPEVSSPSPQHNFHTGPNDLAVAWAISSDEDLASDGAYPNSVISIEAVCHVLSHENLNILASVGATDAGAVWLNSLDSGANNSLGPAAEQQYSTIFPNPITPPVGLAELTVVWYSSDKDQSSYSASAPPSDWHLSQADSSMRPAQVYMAVDSVTPSHITLPCPFTPTFFDFVDDTWLPAEEDSGDSNNEQWAADTDDTEEFVL
ncbi:hypothetical protein CVT25_001007 [Psilocybe cyanescens]|uniref:Uncharacterized protein n=1 Tax=Psilocybe cyanescens TaxID=93625 RepID=A0A409XB82_PSICY|nr:hypothetical protein CVT25_001007 [Psilocybe cyanescens]